MSVDAQHMLALGESGRYEFKRDAEAVSPKVLAALANWVALDPTREVAHLLVGVDEVEDAKTGLVYGVPCGLPKGLDRAVARIQDIASKTRPIPVEVFIIEEAVDEEVPFLRVEVGPTMPPHFDDEGRRQTRQGRSTRALTDDELLRIYLDREAGSFAARFRQTTTELQSAVGVVGNQVDQIAAGIEKHIAEPIAFPSTCSAMGTSPKVPAISESPRFIERAQSRPSAARKNPGTESWPGYWRYERPKTPVNPPTPRAIDRT